MELAQLSATPIPVPNLVQIRPRDLLCKLMKYNKNYLFIYLFIYSYTFSQALLKVKPLTDFDARGLT